MLPVLIGSNALCHYGYSCNPSDIDLIVDEDIKKSLINTGEIRNHILFVKNGDYEVKIDMNPTSVKNTSKLIFDLCNEKKIDIQIINLEDLGLDVIIPPLEILYVIKKCHIHRLLPLTPNQSTNIDIWKKHMKMYEWIRRKLGYKRMDGIIYDNYDPKPNQQLKDESFFEYNIRKIFLERFDEVNKRIPDTKTSLEQDPTEFFNDNVERFIDHDELHRIIAENLRGTRKLLFEKYQKTKNVSMDKETFLKADNNDKINILKEEIMVLFLERKLIPELVHFYKDEYRSFDPKNTDMPHWLEEMDNIICHFITNLCGSGHSWLRNYALDHYEIVSDLETYDYDILFNIGVKISGVKKYKHKESTILSIDNIYNKLFDYTNNVDGDKNYWWFNIIKTPISYYRTIRYKIKIEDNIIEEDANTHDDNNNKNLNFELKNTAYKEIIQKICQSTEDYYDYFFVYNDNIIYNGEKDIGIFCEEGVIKMIFSLKINCKENYIKQTYYNSPEFYKCTVGCMYHYLDNDENNHMSQYSYYEEDKHPLCEQSKENYELKLITYYDSAAECLGCDGEVKGYYTSSYGSTNGDIYDFVEYIVSRILSDYE